MNNFPRKEYLGFEYKNQDQDINLRRNHANPSEKKFPIHVTQLSYYPYTGRKAFSDAHLTEMNIISRLLPSLIVTIACLFTFSKYGCSAESNKSIQTNIFTV